LNLGRGESPSLLIYKSTALTSQANLSDYPKYSKWAHYLKKVFPQNDKRRLCEENN
jgi:hypothetical protein